MNYHVDIPKPIRLWIDQKCPGNYRQRLKRAVQSLSSVPYPNYAERLAAPLEDFYSLHIDNYRIIYTVGEKNSG